MSRRAYAAARGVSEGAVRKAILSGRIRPTSSGKIDPRQADAGWYRSSAAAARDGYLEPDPPSTPGGRKDDRISDAEIKAFLAEQRIFGEPDDRVIDLLTEIKASLAALHRDLLTDRPRDNRRVAPVACFAAYQARCGLPSASPRRPGRAADGQGRGVWSRSYGLRIFRSACTKSGGRLWAPQEFLVVRRNHRIPYWRGLCNDAGCARGSASK
jgi:hypothetical protein